MVTEPRPTLRPLWRPVGAAWSSSGSFVHVRIVQLAPADNPFERQAVSQRSLRRRSGAAGAFLE